MNLDDFATSTDPAAAAAPKGWESGVEVGADGTGTITSGPVTEKVADWSALLSLWNLDPDAFEVVEPVTFKAWDGFAKETNEDGTQKVVSKRLYSYKARIQRRNVDAVPAETIEAWHKKLLKVAGIPRPTLSRGGGETYAMFVADPQLGKKRTHEAVENWKRGVLAHVAECERRVNAGHKITQVLVGFMGDEHEQVCNNYANQPYTVELNLSEQIELDFALRLWTIEQVAGLGLPVLVTSVISNHGEWTRNDSKDPVTSKADNSSTCVMRLVAQTVERIPNLGHITFNVAESNPDIVVEVSGVKVVLSHGHIAKGKGSTSEQKVKNAIERQILGRTSEIGDAQVYVTAHYHHFHAQEFEGRTLFGCPALEAERSSEYMLDQYGVWSPPGMLGFLISSKYPRGWHAVNVY